MDTERNLILHSGSCLHNILIAVVLEEFECYSVNKVKEKGKPILRAFLSIRFFTIAHFQIFL